MEPPRRCYPVIVGLCLLCAGAPALALYDPAKEYAETPEVAARFPDPVVEIATPAFRAGRTDFTSQEEMIAFVEELARRNPALRVRIVGFSQEHRAIPLLLFSRPAGSDGDIVKSGKPTVLVIGQQHGNEPAGGEAVLALALQLSGEEGGRLLERINVLLVPRANPDGAFHFIRGLVNGADVNRDHLLESTPEGRALGRVFADYQPDVVLDCHEFGVKTRWFEKFHALQGYDALIQYATISNLPPALTEASERLFREPLLRAFERAGLRHSWYYTSSYDVNDKRVSMGGVVPDTGRNIAGLRNAVSFLLETRGVGIGRAHYKRRVYTHLVAMNAILASSATHADELVALNRHLRQEIAAAAGQGDLVVASAAAATRHTLEMLNPETGADTSIEVDWRSALDIRPLLTRSRPYGYLLPSSEARAAEHLHALGVSVMRLDEGTTLDVGRYRVTAADEARKDDVRRNDEDPPTSVVRITSVVEAVRVDFKAGDFYVPLDQPLANLVAAALEPETQSSYAANRLLTLPPVGNAARVLPLYRVPERPSVAMTVWEGGD